MRLPRISLKSRQPCRESQSGPSVNWNPSASFSRAAPGGTRSWNRGDVEWKVIRSSATDRADAEVAEGDGAVVALEHDGAGLSDLVIQSAAGGVREGGVVDDVHSVQHHGRLVALDPGVYRLPLAGGLGRIGTGGHQAIDRAVDVAFGRLAVVVLDLDLVAAAQVDAAVAAGRVHVFVVDVKVLELLV